MLDAPLQLHLQREAPRVGEPEETTAHESQPLRVRLRPRRWEGSPVLGRAGSRTSCRVDDRVPVQARRARPPVREESPAMNVASEQTGRGTGTPVVPSPIVVRLTLVLAVVVAVAAAVGLFAGGGPGPHAVLTVRGQ